MHAASTVSRLGSEAPFGHRGCTRLPERSVAASRAPQRTAAALVSCDYRRMGLPGNGWRSFRLDGLDSPSTYPSEIFVPTTMRDDDLIKAASFRGTRAEDGSISGRLPAIVWRHSTGVVIARSGQPRPGVRGERCDADETLIREIAAAGDARHNGAPNLDIYDARPRLNAEANRAKGGGYEVVVGTGYCHCSLQFLGIANIHEVRKSLLSLSKELCPAIDSDGNKVPMPLWGRNGADGGVRSWLDHQATILSGARAITCTLVAGRSVLVHCTDGWDRTPQLTATAQLLLDGYYRTFEGFVTLVQREWLDFGHTFSKRCHRHHEHHLDASASADTIDEELSPIFLQWIEVVWQLTRQFENAFEFSQSFLLELIDAAYSCGWSTFLGDTTRERQQASANRSACFWQHILGDDSRRRHANYMWRGGSADSATDVLFPAVTVGALHLWDSLHLSSPHLHPQSFRWSSHPANVVGRTGEQPMIYNQDTESAQQSGNMIVGASLDSSQFAITENFFGSAPQPEPEATHNSVLVKHIDSNSSISTVIVPPATDLPACLSPDCSWKPDTATARCGQCNCPWSSTLRRHHCRLCGGLFCYSCAPERAVTAMGTSSQTKMRCCASCKAVLELSSESTDTHWSPDALTTALRTRWRSRLIKQQQQPVTDMQGKARRPGHYGGAGPWLTAVLRGCAWRDPTAESLLDQVAEELDSVLTNDAVAAAEALSGRRVQQPTVAVTDAVGQAAGEVLGEAAAIFSRGLSGVFGRK